MQVLRDEDVGLGFRFQGWHSSFCQFRDPGRTRGPDPTAGVRGGQQPPAASLELFTETVVAGESWPGQKSS